MKLRWPFTGPQTTVLGMAFLAASLVERHFNALHGEAMVVACHWIGTILVVVGVGRILFLEDRF